MAPPTAPIILSTDMFPEHERFDAWRETFALRLARVDVRTSDRSKFRAAIGMQALGQLSLVTCELNQVEVLRTRDLIRDADDDISLVIGRSGAFSSRMDEGDLAINAGEATLIQHHVVCATAAGNPMSSLSVRFPRALWRELIGPAREPPRITIPRDNQALRLIATYADGLAANISPLRNTTAALAGQQISELIAHLFDPLADIVRSERFGGVKAARLEAIMAGIDRHLVDPALSAAWLGAKLGLSERYVHHLMAEAGLGFARVVREKRLDRARQMLKSRSARARPIVDIAYAVGFNDLPNFNRAFRQRFGCTPSDIRRGH